jgi:uncharacterized protein YbaP (TraB family)
MTGIAMRSMLACFLFVSMPLLAQDVPSTDSQVGADSEIRDMDAVIVTGVQPGPGMWKISRGDHVLWIMGTLTPLPKGMTWLSRDVQAVLAQADEVIDPPGANFDSDVGMFRGMLMIPSLLKARKNPDGKTLSEILPAPIYARWSSLKAKYLGRDAGIEKWRPVFASQELYQAAIKKSGLTQSGVVGPVVDRLAKAGKIKRTPAIVKVTVENPKQVIKEFSAVSLADIDCFDKTLTRLESDLPLMAARANAWSIGDIEALRLLPYEDQNRTCMNAFLQTGIAQKRGMDTLPQRVEAMWLAKAEAALVSNKVTFSTLPISTLLKPNGYLSKLAAKGYVIEEP